MHLVGQSPVVGKAECVTPPNIRIAVPVGPKAVSQRVFGMVRLEVVADYELVAAESRIPVDLGEVGVAPVLDE